ncbi:MAG: type II toxin-antitoxin system RelE/ParE family toxin [Gemmatimonadota bacterium]
MPCSILLYQESKGVVPFHDWLITLTRPSKKQNLKAAARVKSLIEMLAREGHGLRRPIAAPLAGGIHELRARVGTVNYRVLYFFAGSGVAVLALGCTKEGEVDSNDISTAAEYKEKFEKDPKKHTYVESTVS